MRIRLRRDIHGDDEIGAHVACKAHGHGSDEAAIDIGVAGDRHGLEHAGHGRRGAHGHAGVATLKQDRLAIFQIGRHHAKRNLQLFQRHAADSLVDIALQRLALEHAGRLAEQGQGPVGNGRLVHVERHLLQGEAGVAGRIQGAHHAAGAGAGDDVGVDALRFERLDHADMREAARRATTERQANLDLARRDDDGLGWRQYLYGFRGGGIAAGQRKGGQGKQGQAFREHGGEGKPRAAVATKESRL